MNVNRRLFNQYFIREDEVYSHKKKVESINERILTLSKRMFEQGWTTHRDTFVKFTDWIGVHENPTADYEKNKRWVILPSQELVDYFNRLWVLSSYDKKWYSVSDEVSAMVSAIFMKLEEPPF